MAYQNWWLKTHRIWQAADNSRRLIILRPGVVFGTAENGNFTRLYWALRGHKFMFPGRRDTIKACIYVKDLVRLMLHLTEQSQPGVALYNCTYYPAYTIQEIVDNMLQATGLKRTIPRFQQDRCSLRCHHRAIRREKGPRNLSGKSKKADDFDQYFGRETIPNQFQIQIFVQRCAH